MKNKKIKKIVKLEGDAEKLRALFANTRLDKKLDQVKFAEILKSTQSSISKIEAGVMPPNVFLYLRLTRIFKVSLK